MTDIGLYHNNFFLFVSQNFYIVGKQDISYPRVLFSRIGRSVIIGSQKIQIYQWFAGGQQEVFILKIQNSENNAAYVDSRRRFI